MQTLQLKVPPVVVLFAALLLVYASSHLPATLPITELASLWIYAPAMVGILIISIGVWTFKKAKTTVNPTSPQNTSSLVQHGIYGYTRNPMYLGMAFVLGAAILHTLNIISVSSLFLFVCYMNQFKIKPEEQMIESIFGEEYLAYKKRVRRWL